MRMAAGTQRECAERDVAETGSGPDAERWLVRRGHAVGYVVVTDREVDAVRGRFVLDLVFPGSPSWLARWSMWLQLAADGARSGSHALVFFYNRANPRLARLASLPLVTVGRERLPQRVPVFVRPAPGAAASRLEAVDWSRGYFLMSDFDLF